MMLGQASQDKMKARPKTAQSQQTVSDSSKYQGMSPETRFYLIHIIVVNYITLKTV